MQVTRGAACAALFSAAASPFLASLPALAAPGDTQVVGSVRVEALSPSLVRLEVKGPKGFEDRTTFHVVERQWPGATLTRREEGGFVSLATPGWTVRIPADAASLDGVTITDATGKTLYAAPKTLTNAAWLPSPADRSAAWGVADTPRLAPPAWGATPPPAGNAAYPDTSGWDVGNDAPDLYVFLPPGGDYRQLRTDYLRLTGRTELPPLYLFGLFHSRYYPYKQDEAREVIATYRRKQIPLDVMVLDTDWRVGASVGYAANTDLFPDLPGYLKAVHAEGIRTMFNDHPEPHVADALNPVEMAFRYDGLSQWLNQGLDIWWYDRNWGVSLKSPAPGLRHEVWGMRVYHDMTQKAAPGRRPAIMANVDGIDNGFRHGPPDMAAHRFPIQWTGDTRAQWAFLRYGVENAVYSGVHSLVPYMSEDLGGHVGRPSPELYVRYLEYGALSPVMRPHCTRGQTRAPWEFGPEAERIVTGYARMRYRLLPYLYAASRANYDTGEPLVRRLDLDYPAFPESAADDEYLLGPSLLVAPIVDGPDAHPVPAAWLTTPDGKPGLAAAYFAAPEPAGTPKVTRTDQALAFDWGEGSPDPNIPADHFSARWTGKITNRLANPATLLVTADDGVRVFLDGKRVVDEWHAADSVTYTVRPALAPGSSHALRVEYLEQTGNARISLAFREEQPGGSAAGAARRGVWVPPGTWTDAWTGARVAGPKQITASAPLARTPLFVRPGAIVPLVPQMQYTSERPWDRVALDVFPAAGQSGNASLYEDDTTTNDYQTGAFRTTRLQDAADPRTRSVRVAIGSAAGRAFPGAVARRRWIVRVHRPAGWPSSWRAVKVLAGGQSVKGWRVLPRAGSGAAMPFQTDGPAPDGEVVQIDLPAAPVGAARDVTVVYGG